MRELDCANNNMWHFFDFVIHICILIFAVLRYRLQSRITVLFVRRKVDEEARKKLHIEYKKSPYSLHQVHDGIDTRDDERGEQDG